MDLTAASRPRPFDPRMLPVEQLHESPGRRRSLLRQSQEPQFVLGSPANVISSGRRARGCLRTGRHPRRVARQSWQVAARGLVHFRRTCRWRPWAAPFARLPPASITCS